MDELVQCSDFECGGDGFEGEVDGGVLVVNADEEVGEEGGGCVACANKVLLVGDWPRVTVEGKEGMEDGGWWGTRKEKGMGEGWWD